MLHKETQREIDSRVRTLKARKEKAIAQCADKLQIMLFDKRIQLYDAIARQEFSSNAEASNELEKIVKPALERKSEIIDAQLDEIELILHLLRHDFTILCMY